MEPQKTRVNYHVGRKQPRHPLKKGRVEEHPHQNRRTPSGPACQLARLRRKKKYISSKRGGKRRGSRPGEALREEGTLLLPKGNWGSQRPLRPIRRHVAKGGVKGGYGGGEKRGVTYSLGVKLFNSGGDNTSGVPWKPRPSKGGRTLPRNELA